MARPAQRRPDYKERRREIRRGKLRRIDPQPILLRQLPPIVAIVIGVAVHAMHDDHHRRIGQDPGRRLQIEDAERRSRPVRKDELASLPVLGAREAERRRQKDDQRDEKSHHESVRAPSCGRRPACLCLEALANVEIDLTSANAVIRGVIAVGFISQGRIFIEDVVRTDADPHAVQKALCVNVILDIGVGLGPGVDEERIAIGIKPGAGVDELAGVVRPRACAPATVDDAR
jgi:hypothetical protein